MGTRHLRNSEKLAEQVDSHCADTAADCTRFMSLREDINGQAGGCENHKPSYIFPISYFYRVTYKMVEGGEFDPPLPDKVKRFSRCDSFPPSHSYSMSYVGPGASELDSMTLIRHLQCSDLCSARRILIPPPQG